MHPTMRFKSALIASYLVIIIIPLSLVFVLLDNRLEEHALHDIKTSLIAQAQLVERQISATKLFSVPAAVLEEEAALLSARIQCRITIIATNGVVIADSEKSSAAIKQMENHLNRPEIRSAMAGAVGSDTRRSATLNIDMLYVAVPVKEKAAVTGVVRLALPLTNVERVLSVIRSALLVALFVALIAAFILGSFLASRISGPVNDMIQVSRKFAQGDLSRRIICRAGGEIGELAATLNAMAQDIEDKIKIVRTQNQKLAAILNSMVEGIIAVDSGGHIVSINPTIETVFGLHAGEVEGKAFLEAIRNNEIADIITRALHKGEYISTEIGLLLPVRKVFQITATPLFDRARVTGCLVVIHDTTELRRLETVRRDFVANVSHELKTPLTSIQGFVETLLEGALEDKEHSRQFLTIIQEHTGRISHLVDDLLSLSSLESHEITLSFSSVRVREQLEEIVLGFKTQLRKKQLRITNDVPSSLVLAADRDRLGQVFTNLIDNAIKFNKEKGSITVSAKEADGMITISVEDSGLGIPATDIPRIFERFYRVDKARSRELGGTGLGLSIVKHIVELHHGSVGVESTEGIGSKFFVTLPLRGPHA